MGRKKLENAKVIKSFRMRPELLERLEEWKEKNGYKSTGEALEYLLTRALTSY